MSGDTEGKIYKVVSADGSDYVVHANDFAEAYNKFKKWYADPGDDPNDWEDPQLIAYVGDLIVT
jgi:hypothetical protein